MAKKLMDYAEDFEHIAILKQAQKHQYKLELEFNGILDCRQVAEIIEAGKGTLFTLYPILHAVGAEQGQTRLMFQKKNTKFIEQIESLVQDSATEMQEALDVQATLKIRMEALIKKDGSLAKGLMNALKEYLESK